MKSVIMDGPMQIRVGAWGTPRPGPDEVLVAVAVEGICAGDLSIYRGVNPYAVYPCIGGHKIAGTIAEVGSDRATRGKAA